MRHRIGRIHYGLMVVFCFKHFIAFHYSSSYKTALGHWPHVNVCRVSFGGVFNMLLVLSITFFFITIYGFCVFNWTISVYVIEKICLAHVIIILKSEVSTFPIVIIYFRGCVSEVFVTSYSVIYCIYTFRENREFVFIISVQFMMSANSQIRFDLKIVFVYLCITPSQYHHCASLSEDIELIKCLSDMVCRVCE